MPRKRTLVLLLVVLGLRLVLQGWDAGTGSSSPHPDERQVGYVSERATGWFVDPHFYAYGSLHFQAVRAATAVLVQDGFSRSLILGGRSLSLFASIMAILLGWVLARRAWGERTGELFLLLVAWVPLDLQQSHFATVEAHHAAWVMAALAACFWFASKGSNLSAAATGAAIGASLAVKVSSLALAVPLGVALVIVARRVGTIRGGPALGGGDLGRSRRILVFSALGVRRWRISVQTARAGRGDRFGYAGRRPEAGPDEDGALRSRPGRGSGHRGTGGSNPGLQQHRLVRPPRRRPQPRLSSRCRRTGGDGHGRGRSSVCPRLPRHPPGAVSLD